MLDQTRSTIERLALIPVFQDLSDDLIDEIRQHSRVFRLEPGEILYRHFEGAKRSCFCISGRLKLFRLTRAGNEKIFRFAGPGDCVSTPISFNPGRSHALNCTAIRASRVLSVDTEVMNRVFDRSRMARTRIVNLLLEHVDELINHVELLSEDKAAIRVASWLINEHERNNGGASFNLASTKKQIAAFLALQPETFSRCLKKLRDTGIASTKGNEITVLDIDRLTEISGRMRKAA